MKTTLSLLLLIPVLAFGQLTEQLDFIAPLNDDVIAVKKGDSWGFLNKKGDIIIAFRNDLVVHEIVGYNYPIFENNRCQIFKKEAGITYFGFIDKTGETVIEPKFLNASNFKNNKAIVLYITKEKLGTNSVLGKNIINYKYHEVIITIDGTIQTYLNPQGIHVVLDKKFLKNPPEITSKQIFETMYAVKTQNNKWKIVRITN